MSHSNFFKDKNILVKEGKKKKERKKKDSQRYTVSLSYHWPCLHILNLMANDSMIKDLICYTNNISYQSQL